MDFLKKDEVDGAEEVVTSDNDDKIEEKDNKTVAEKEITEPLGESKDFNTVLEDEALGESKDFDTVLD